MLIIGIIIGCFLGKYLVKRDIIQFCNKEIDLVKGLDKDNDKKREAEQAKLKNPGDIDPKYIQDNIRWFEYAHHKYDFGITCYNDVKGYLEK